MRVIAFIIILLNSAAAFGQFAEFSFSEKPIYKADPIQEGDELKYTWHFSNSGDTPLIITGYEVECPCTKLSYPKGPIFPGQSDSLQLSFDSKGKMGWQYRKVILQANTKKQTEEIEFRVKVNQVP